MSRKWHDLSQEEHDTLSRPRTDEELDRILQAVYGRDLRAVTKNIELWCNKARKEGLCWWGFDALTPQGEEVTISVFFWDLDLVLTHDQRTTLGEAECLALEARLSQLAREWGVSREEDVSALATVKVTPGKRRRPSGLARLLPTC